MTEKYPVGISAAVILPISETPNANGRVYSRDVLKEAIEKIDKLPVTVSVEDFYSEDGVYGPKPSAVIGEVSTVRIDGNNVIGKIALTEAAGKAIEGYLNNGLVFRTAGVGQIDERGNVYDFSLTGVFLTNDPSSPNR